MSDEEIRPFNEQTTYYGTLDDVVYRYPWGRERHGRPLDLRAIRSQLMTAVIYDKTVIINDGYLVTNPLISPDLMNPVSSLLGTMVKGNAAYLYSRNGETRLEDGIERVASGASPVSSMRKIIENRELWGQLRWGLRSLDDLARGKVLAWPGDKNMGEAFYLLMKSLVERSGAETGTTIPDHLRADFDVIFRMFEDRLDDSFDAARSKWEEVCWRHCEGRDIDETREGSDNFSVEQLRDFATYDRVRVFMNIANEMYHLAQSAGAARSMAQSPVHPLSRGGKCIGVATALVDDHLGMVAPRWVRPDEARDRAISQLMLSVPPDLRFTGDFSFVEKFGHIRVVHDDRAEYLAMLHDFANDRMTLDRAVAIRNGYAQRLSELMAGHVQANRPLRHSGQLLQLILAQATAAMAPAGGWLLGIGLDSLHNRLIERVGRDRIATTLLRDGLAAAQGGMTRDEGLYLGPLDGAGIDRILNRVGPHPAVRPSPVPPASDTSPGGDAGRS